ncbi:hypothetical protein GCM10009745_71810 [Kribbella yunnanensis]|uniref:Uncharacterized protein n=1 Tax=Kribbella yunnanensis TaxID=190194 RepID=A0ABP4UW83_9ACTN
MEQWCDQYDAAAAETSLEHNGEQWAGCQCDKQCWLRGVVLQEQEKSGREGQRAMCALPSRYPTCDAGNRDEHDTDGSEINYIASVVKPRRDRPYRPRQAAPVDGCLEDLARPQILKKRDYGQPGQSGSEQSLA